MKKLFPVSLLTIAFLSLVIVCHAQTQKTITLKDGSILKGKVLGLKDNIYTVETSDLGTITVPAGNIVNIASPQKASTQKQVGQGDTQKAELKKQMQQIQGAIMADQDIMSDMEGLANNEEVRAMLSDPELLNDVMSMDPDKIQGNSKVQNLMNNPQIQQLMQKIQKKYPTQ